MNCDPWLEFLDQMKDSKKTGDIIRCGESTMMKDFACLFFKILEDIIKCLNSRLKTVDEPDLNRIQHSGL